MSDKSISTLSFSKILSKGCRKELSSCGIKSLSKFKLLNRGSISALPLGTLSRKQIFCAWMKLMPEAMGGRNSFGPMLSQDQTADILIDLYDYRNSTISDAKNLGEKTLFNSIIIVTIDTIFDIFDALDFYGGKRQIKLSDAPSSRMLGRAGVITLWKMARSNPDLLVKHISSGKLKPELLPLITETFYRILCSLYIDYEECRYLFLDGFKELLIDFSTDEENRCGHDMLIAKIEEIIITLEERRIFLSMMEHEVYDNHKDWECPCYEDEIGGPYDGRELRENFSVLSGKYYKEHGIPLREFYELRNQIQHFIDDDPRPFMSYQRDYADEMVRLLSKPVTFYYNNPLSIEMWGEESLEVGFLSEDVVNEKNKLCESVLCFFDNHAMKCSSKGEARRLWFEAAAELMSSQQYSFDRFPLSEDAANKVIERAKCAARAEWIEKRISRDAKSDSDSKELYLMRMAEATEQQVEIARKQNQTDEELCKMLKKQVSPAKVGRRVSDCITPGRACKSFVTYCNPKTMTIKMKVHCLKGETNELTFKFHGENTWDVVMQLVMADTYPVILKNPRKKGGKMDLAKLFRKTQNKGNNRDEFFRYVKNVKPGSKAAYELVQTPVRRRKSI